jgi:sensor domain CHASE-containing protein
MTDEVKLKRLVKVYESSAGIDYLTFMDQMGVLELSVIKELKSKQASNVKIEKLLERFRSEVIKNYREKNAVPPN